MPRLRAFAGALAALVLAAPLSAQTVTNPDEITVYFPPLEGERNLGSNVAMVLSLQLAQTGRQKPWPDNPLGHDFNTSVMAWSDAPLAAPSHDAAAAAATDLDLLAQIVVWGDTRSYAGEVIAEVNVTLPRYAKPSACRGDVDPCDYRAANLETWTIIEGDSRLSVGPPRRRFGLSAIRLRADVVDAFGDVEGLPIRSGLRDGEVLGRTGLDLRFLEFNPQLPGAPTKVQSRGVTGYVEMPRITERASEYADMVGGILQVFRGDWRAARQSFGRVVENPATRTPLRLDALLYRGMAAFRDGEDGMADFEAALALAPYDRRAVQFAVMGHLARGTEAQRARASDLLGRQRHLFEPDDAWFTQARRLSSG
ncbi:MAG: tetratricopeptide repeat protein [Pseudomonadota bacterium]